VLLRRAIVDTASGERPRHANVCAIHADDASEPAITVLNRADDSPRAIEGQLAAQAVR
jgi:hypothetical protein